MNQIHNPAIPFNAPIPGGMHPGKMIKIHGSVPPTSHRFAVNLLNGPMGDIALHICPKFHDKHVIRNSVQNMHWGHEEKHGHMPIHHGQTFEMLILCEPHHFRIAFNGHHFCEFNHRISYTAITNIGIDGEVTIFSISFEGSSHTAGGGMGFVPPHVPYVPPAGHVPHMPPTGHVPPHSSGVGIPYPVHPNPIHHAGSPYPHSNPVYPPGHTSHASQPSYPTATPYPSSGQGLYPGQGAYPSTGQPGVYPHSPQPHKKEGILDKAGMAVAGVLGASALTGVVGHKKASKLGILGTALGAGATGAALTGHLNPIKGMKKQAKAQRKAQKKALKYGLPIAGAGLGAYALHKGLSHHHHGFHHHGHHRSSSSSSSSSSD